MHNDLDKIPSRLLKVKAHIEKHYTESVSLDELASSICITKKYLYTAFKRHFGIPPLQFLISLRMNKAVALLENVDLNISEISALVGYNGLEYFSRHFHKYFGVSPTQKRKEISLVSASRVLWMNVPAPVWQNGDSLQEKWKTVFEADFSQLSELDTRLNVYWYQDSENEAKAPQHRAPERIVLEDGMLRLLPAFWWTHLRWEEDLSEEACLDVVIDNRLHDGIDIYLAVSGDLLTGYRLYLQNYDNIVLETVQNGIWEVLHVCDILLDREAPQYHVSIWRERDTFYAEIDGQRILEYDAPFSLTGDACRTVALGSHFNTCSADIHLLRILSRRSPMYVSILEPGRMLMSQGAAELAWKWYVRTGKDITDPALRNEAAYLAALAMPDHYNDIKDAALQAIGNDATHPFVQQALRELALFRLSQRDIAGVMTALTKLLTLNPSDETPHLVADRLRPFLGESIFEEKQSLLSAIAKLPLQRLSLINTSITSLTPIAGMPLTSLKCVNNNISDLSPLQGMPLRNLHFGNNHISDISPLQGMLLADCEFNNNQVTDLTPLAESPLVSLQCNSNAIASLSPLQGMHLRLLDCRYNQITDLTPLSRSPLLQLMLTWNSVSDLTPLQGLPLHRLECGGNPIRDLSPLASCPLTILDCRNTSVEEITPLAGKNIAVLLLDSVQFTASNDAVLHQLPLRQLEFNIMMQEKLPTIADIPTLRQVNSHSVSYVLSVLDPIHLALRAWKAERNSKSAPTHPVDLRHWATECAGRRLLAIPHQMTWHDAEAFCESHGGHLACPTTQESTQALFHFLASVCDSSLQCHYHLGLFYRDEHWQWITGEPVRWNNLTAAIESTEAYAHISYPDEVTQNTWYRENAAESCYFVIEWS